MAYWWKPGSGSYSPESLQKEGLMPRFEDQGRAEEWLSSFFADLVECGVADVTLYEEERPVYGPMSLDA
ncbi:hypothetical protein [Tessaracoccus antarcticus]|uniref:Uncharacterized protein n=1 Tax=Tessaracoccus antarcticus TaxID=2479848 RepID=A0A3M0GQS3_9ACTN|nr:hypothetical protein [Tessaracoccus antarcticus]RMB59636.1 hypothetical protein EAX62_07630 [Tessaracoccus antarcticus]